MQAKPADNAALVAMGFDDQDVRAALQQLPAGASMQQAVDRLVAADGASAVPVDDAGKRALAVRLPCCLGSRGHRISA